MVAPPNKISIHYYKLKYKQWERSPRQTGGGRKCLGPIYYMLIRWRYGFPEASKRGIKGRHLPRPDVVDLDGQATVRLTFSVIRVHFPKRWNNPSDILTIIFNISGLVVYHLSWFSIVILKLLISLLCTVVETCVKVSDIVSSTYYNRCVWRGAQKSRLLEKIYNYNFLNFHLIINWFFNF